MRMTLTLDDALVNELLADQAGKTKREVIETALEDALRDRRRKKALLHRGKIILSGDAGDLERMRSES
ncbi:MAG: type II toxin-antitoxin system VapB family antitoxin [Spirochaetota bacterium]